MTYWIIRLQGAQNFHLRLWQSLGSTSQRVYVDWPEAFLDKFCRSIGAEYLSEATQKGQPCPIKLETWVRAHINFSILAVSYGNNDILTLTLKKQPDDKEQWRQQLETAMPRLSSVEFVTNK